MVQETMQGQDQSERGNGDFYPQGFRANKGKQIGFVYFNW